MNDLARISEVYDFEAALEAASQGKRHREIAAAMGMNERVYYRLRANNTLFKESVDRARAQGLEILKDSTLDLVDENQHLSPQLVKIKADLLLWYLKVSDPVQFGDRMTVREEHVDLKGALLDARTRVITTTGKHIPDPFED